MSGQLIGNRYRVLRKIGEGGMAVVHLAVDETLRRDVAIKILKDRFESHAEIRSRFQHEAQVISKLNQPNILKIYDFSGNDSKQLWIVTELVHGRNVAQILETTVSGWLHPVIAAAIIREVCRALTMAHDEKIVHRDIKPENVMITHTGNVKLMDFGIAKMQQSTSMTQTGMFMGSPSYMSPEQIRGRDIDHRSDIYSLGVMFYELLTGRLPFTGSSTADVAMKILGGEYTHPRYLMSGLPQELNDCVTACMQLAPESRPGSVLDVGSIIDQFLQQAGLESSDLELQRCFRDPLAYGERLARVLRVTNANAKSTVVVDELLPPKAPMHSARSRQNPESIAKNLPERRHRQRPSETNVAAAAAPIYNHNAPARVNPPRHNQPADPNATVRLNAAAQPIIKVQINAQPPAPVIQQAPVQPQPPRDYRRVYRTVPPIPRRKITHRHYVIRETSSSRSDRSFFGAFVAAVVILFVVGLAWNSQKKPKLNQQKQAIAATQKSGKKTPTAAPKSDPGEIDEKPPQASESPAKNGNAKELTASPTAKPAPDTQKSAKTQKPGAKPSKLATDSKTKPKDKNPSTRTTQSSNQAPAIVNTDASENVGRDNDDTVAPSVIPAAKPSDKSPEKSDNKPADASGDKATDKRPAPQNPQTSKVRIAVSSTPAAELFIDGKRGGTTNDLGTSSDWITVSSGNHRVELRRSGYQTRIETIAVNSDQKQKFGPYTLQRAESGGTAKSGSYRLTISTNTPPVTVTIVNIESRVTQNINMSQSVQSLNLERGIYDVTMIKGNETRKRRIDFTGSSQQLTFSVEFKPAPPPQEQ